MYDTVTIKTANKMSSFSTAKPKKMNPLDKVIPKNPKYASVQSTLDTGSSITKYMKKIEEIKASNFL